MALNDQTERIDRLKIVIMLVFFVSALEAGPGENRSALDDAAGHVESPDRMTDDVKVLYAGVRSSSYGISPFPEPDGWKNAIEAMRARYKGSRPCVIWVVGKIRERTCCLSFPSTGKQYPNISFEETDANERYLRYFNQAGIQVFLQVEPADADVHTLIDLVLGRYKHHPCVIGFGMDVEWLRGSDNLGWGARVGDSSAQAWEARIKAHHNRYQLFLKHWDPRWMPPKYRGDIVFANDSQGFSDLDEMVGKFDYWAFFFYPNTVFYQVGYGADQKWWKKLNNPTGDIGKAISDRIEQHCGIFWVDFTLRDVLPTK